MKMSFFWVVMLIMNAAALISAIVRGDFDVWFYVDIAGLILSAYLYWDARKTERRDAEANRQFINIVINHLNNEPADVTAKRVSDLQRNLS